MLLFQCLLEDLIGIKITVTGDDLTNDKKRSLIILNHRTRLDWMFIWMVHSRFGILEQLKIVLKAALKRIPGPGWAMQHAAYLFLDRVWEKDQVTINNICGYYKSCQSPLSVSTHRFVVLFDVHREVSRAMLHFSRSNRKSKRVVQSSNINCSPWLILFKRISTRLLFLF